MRIVSTKFLRGEYGSLVPGQEVVVRDDIAKDLVKAGYATEWKPSAPAETPKSGPSEAPAAEPSQATLLGPGETKVAGPQSVKRVKGQ